MTTPRKRPADQTSATTAPNTPLLVDTVEAARLMGIDRTTLYRLLSAGLPSIKLGRARRISLRAIETWIAEQESTNPASDTRHDALPPRRKA